MTPSKAERDDEDPGCHEMCPGGRERGDDLGVSQSRICCTRARPRVMRRVRKRAVTEGSADAARRR
jgi:hypothetical protein